MWHFYILITISHIAYTHMYLHIWLCSSTHFIYSHIFVSISILITQSHAHTHRIYYTTALRITCVWSAPVLTCMTASFFTVRATALVCIDSSIRDSANASAYLCSCHCIHSYMCQYQCPCTWYCLYRGRCQYFHLYITPYLWWCLCAEHMTLLFNSWYF
jgi:hypothetical protein